MGLLIALLLFVVAPILELYVLIQIGSEIGVLWTITALIGVSVVGTWLAKREGFRVFRSFLETSRKGEVPSREMVHGVCVLVAGVLLFLPGFIGDALGLLLLLPPVRAGIVSLVLRRSQGRTTVITATYSGPIVETSGELRPPTTDTDDTDDRN
jgi:UPF0716 protein FxsA